MNAASVMATSAPSFDTGHTFGNVQEQDATRCTTEGETRIDT